VKGWEREEEGKRDGRGGDSSRPARIPHRFTPMHTHTHTHTERYKNTDRSADPPATSFQLSHVFDANEEEACCLRLLSCCSSVQTARHRRRWKTTVSSSSTSDGAESWNGDISNASPRHGPPTPSAHPLTSVQFLDTSWYRFCLQRTEPSNL